MPVYLFLARVSGEPLAAAGAFRSLGDRTGLDARAATARDPWKPTPSATGTYPVATQFPQLSFANVGDTFDVRDILYPMTGGGRGEARGLELFAEKKSGGKWFGQFNFAYSRARHAGLDGAMRARGRSTGRSRFNAVGGRRISRRLELGFRTAYLTGRPYTPFNLDLSEEQRRGVFDLERGECASLRRLLHIGLAPWTGRSGSAARLSWPTSESRT